MAERQHIEDILRQKKPELKKKYRLKKIGIFGSYSRGEQRKGSDLDLLVEFDETPGFLKYLELEEYLSKATGLKVDLVMKRALKPQLKKYILKEAVYI